MSAPRWARVLLRWLSPTDRSDGILGDLEEAHRRRLDQHGRLLASLLTSIEALDMARALLLAKWHPRKLSSRATSSRRGGTGSLFSTLDLKLGFRMLVRYPGLNLIGGLAMAFGICIGAMTFEAVKQIAHPKIPVDEGERIVGLQQWNVETASEAAPSLHDFELWSQRLESVSDLAAFRSTSRNLLSESGPLALVEVAEVTPSAFRLARVAAHSGRFLVEGDEAPTSPEVVVIGYSVWQSLFGGDNVIGRSVRMDGTPHTIVGVMPEGFGFPVAYDYWVPLRLRSAIFPPAESPRVRVFGRLAPGVSLEKSQAELDAFGLRTASETPQTHQGWRPQIVPYVQLVVPVPDIAWGMVAINVFVAMLLVLICGNVALLMFARAATRESELLVRTALGANRRRIVAQLFAEALILGGVSALVGLSMANRGMGWWLAVLEADLDTPIPFWFRAHLSPTTLLYGLALTLLSATIAGVLPALKVTGRGGLGRLRATSGSGGLRFSGVWNAVIVAQVAVTVAFPAAGFFFERALLKFQNLEIGFDRAQYLSARLDIDPTPRAGVLPGAAAQKATERLGTIKQELERRLEAEPDVLGVTFAQHLPGSYHRQRWIELDRLDHEVENAGLREEPATSDRARVGPAHVTLDYFATLGAPIRLGRGFESGDLNANARVVLVNRSFVEHVLEGRNPIGGRVRYLSDDPEDPEPWYEIIGMVDDLFMWAGDFDPSDDPGLYHPTDITANTADHLVVHVRGNPGSLVPTVRELALELDPRLRLHSLLPLDTMNDDGLYIMTSFLQLIAIVSSIALLLSFATLYSVTSLAVSRRTREIGVRIALGADARSILFAVFRRPIIQVSAGALCGGLFATLSSGASSGGVSLAEGASLLFYAIGMLGVCSLACVVPIRRALRVEPTDALRVDT